MLTKIKILSSTVSLPWIIATLSCKGEENVSPCLLMYVTIYMLSDQINIDLPFKSIRNCFTARITASISRRFMCSCASCFVQQPWTALSKHTAPQPFNNASVVMVTPGSVGCNGTPCKTFSSCSHHWKWFRMTLFTGINTFMSLNLGLQKYNRCNWIGLMCKRPNLITWIVDAMTPKILRNISAEIWFWALLDWINSLILANCSCVADTIPRFNWNCAPMNFTDCEGRSSDFSRFTKNPSLFNTCSVVSLLLQR